MIYSVVEYKWRGRLVRYAPVLFWIGVILYLSSGAGAMSETSRYIRPILEFLFPSADAQTIKIYHGFVRKFAHVAVYFVLGLLSAHAFASSRMAWLSIWWPIAVLAIVAVTAAADEVQQSFNSSRTGAVGDVILDIIGGLISILAFLLLRRVWKGVMRFFRLRRSVR